MHLDDLPRDPQTALMSNFSWEQIARTVPQYVSLQELLQINANLARV